MNAPPLSSEENWGRLPQPSEANRAIPRRRRRNTLPHTPRPEYSRHRHNFFIIASSQPSSRLRDQNLGELRHPHGSDCWVRYGSNNSGQNGGTNDDKGKDCNYLGSGDYSPEKAGVGGSTPSLATIFCKHLATSSHLVLAPIGSTISAVLLAHVLY